MEPSSSPNNPLPAVPGATLPSVWRRCVDLLTGSGGFKARMAWSEQNFDGPPSERGAPVPDWKRPALIGYLIIVLGFGVLGGWSALARLDSAVVAPGTVTLESNKKVIQHFEGGIIKKILVHEGEHVDQGQIVFLLDDTAPQANTKAVHNQLGALLAQEARLLAERNGADKVSYPSELTDSAAEPVVKDAISDQDKQFAERRASLAGQVAILETKIKQSETQIIGISDEKKATEQQLGFINSELVDLRELLAQNLVQKTRVLSLEREAARLEGVIGRAVADIAKAENDIGEGHLQIEQLHKKFSEEVNDQILQVRQKIADLREKLTVSQDVLQRIQIRAPRAGTIQNLHVATVGGVIKPGEPLAELVPDEDHLVINAEVSPSDADAIDAGMQAEVRFSAFHGTVLPLIVGHVDSVSRDRIVDEHSKQSFFLARVVVEQKEIPVIVKDHIKAGMPVEVLVPTGERTVMNYLVRPLRNRANSAFREK